MKKIGIAAAALLIAGILFFYFSGDRTNRLSRLGISYLDGNYTVTYSGYGDSKVWDVTNSKITAEADKGYYFFWADTKINGKKVYVQTPMQFTIIEEK